MHFPIIKIEPIDLAREDWDDYLNYEDATLNENTDYYGELYTPEERRKVIESGWLKELLEGIATIDTENETITFLDKETISKSLNRYFRERAAELLERAEQGRMRGYDFRDAGANFRGFYTLFVDGYGKTSLDFVEGALYYAGETKQIGNIFDAHS